MMTYILNTVFFVVSLSVYVSVLRNWMAKKNAKPRTTESSTNAKMSDEIIKLLESVNAN